MEGSTAPPLDISIFVLLFLNPLRVQERSYCQSCFTLQSGEEAAQALRAAVLASCIPPPPPQLETSNSLCCNGRALCRPCFNGGFSCVFPIALHRAWLSLFFPSVWFPAYHSSSPESSARSHSYEKHFITSFFKNLY